MSADSSTPPPSYSGPPILPGVRPDGVAPQRALPILSLPGTAPLAGTPPALSAGPQRYVAQVVAPSSSPNTVSPPANRRRRQTRRDYFSGRRKFFVSGFASCLFHFVLILWLALLAIEHDKPNIITLEAGAQRNVPKSFARLNSAPSVASPATSSSARAIEPQQLAAALVKSPQLGRQGATVNDPHATTTFDPGNLGSADLLTPVGGSMEGMLDGREGELKGVLLGDGASEGSELAVQRGLRWLAAHQRDDGSWHFNHNQDGSCKYCRNPGNHGSTTAATGLALLPFLGAGHTHERGEYQDTVRRGLDFLKKRMIVTPLGGDLQDGVNLYSQAIATLALCEAYAITRDPELQNACREAIRFIVYAQDKKGGGWRYFPGQVGDTTVTGWMLMALKSGQLTYMPISPDVWPAAKRFLDSVQDDGGAAYGYQAPSKQDATMTAIGLLCRMYFGWPRAEPALARGIRMLSKRGPSETNLYYDYYATQVLRHYGGPEWIAWNLELREHLIRTQAREGHATGSWYFEDQHGDQGGRVYNTAMAVLILEVYYRYLPIYGHRATGNDYRDK